MASQDMESAIAHARMSLETGDYFGNSPRFNSTSARPRSPYPVGGRFDMELGGIYGPEERLNELIRR